MRISGGWRSPGSAQGSHSTSDLLAGDPLLVWLAIGRHGLMKLSSRRSF